MPFGRRTEVEAFEDAALPLLNDLYRTARRFLGSKSDAEDLVHVILRKDDSIASLIITKKLGESYPRGDTAALMHASGIPLHQARLQNYEVTGFETKDRLVFVVSNLAQARHTRIAMTLAPSVRDYLPKLEI